MVWIDSGFAVFFSLLLRVVGILMLLALIFFTVKYMYNN